MTCLFNCKDPSSRLVRWRLKLEEFKYEICYKPGKTNSNADALSQNPVLTVTDNETFENFIKFHYENEELIQYPTLNENIFTKSPNVLLISKDLSPENDFFQNISELYDLNKINIDDVKL